MADQKQLFQIQNILETLIEATDHFSSLIKEKELNQSIYIFSSIVEGSQAIITILNTQDERLTKQTKKLEEYLVYISKELEQSRFIKISEIIQFSLRPLLIKLNESFIDIIGNQKKEKIISIGIFHSWANPREFYPKERLQATLNESMKQNTKLYFFTSTDIDFEKEQVTADTFQNNQWERITVAFPNVINNIGVGNRSQAERKLQRIVPFTGFHVGNKFSLPHRMLKHRKFTELLVPFTVCISESKVYQFLDKNNKVVFKALGSNRGENIYFVNKKGSRYIMLDQKKERILSEDEFQYFVSHTILAEKGSYIIQRYIHTRTKDDEPYHFRSHVQKDHNGEWQITYIYPRIGSKRSNLSNISTEGRIEDFSAFLQEQYGRKQGAIYEKEILDLSINVTKHLDKLYGMALNELGLDFAIDDIGRIWMHEANNGPQTAYHEDKRAINFIAYAKYIAENGVMQISHTSQEAITKGQFQARKTNLPLSDHNAQSSIGMLIGKHNGDTLSIALANTAMKNHIPFYSFTPKDIDYDLGLIRGSFYENRQWIRKVTEFPSVIIDRLKVRSSLETRVIYEELEDIPFTNEWVPDSASRSKMYSLLQDNKNNNKSLAAYQVVKRPLHVFQFLEEYGSAQLKREDMTYSSLLYTIKVLNDKEYEVLDGSTSKKYNENQLRNYINHLIEDNRYIVQQYPVTNDTLPELQSLLMKNETDKWVIISNQMELRTIQEDDSIKLSNQTIEEFAENSFRTTNLNEQLENLAINVATLLDKKINKKLSEMAITFAVEDDNILLVTEINPNGPKIIYDMDLYVETIIKYAINLAKVNN